MLEYIPKGENHAIDRYELGFIANLSDRQLRKEIERLQNEGHPICNLSEGKGYFVAQTERELERYKLQERSRAIKILRKLYKMHL